MNDTPQAMVQRLSEYVNELHESRIAGKQGAIKGRTQMILNVLDKLRNAHGESPLPEEMIARINHEKKRAKLDVPDTSANYQNICWRCGVKVDNRVDSVCKTCGWVQCPECGACKDPKHGGCPANKKIEWQ